MSSNNGLFCVSCLPSTIILSATHLYVLFMRLYASVQLEIRSPGNTNKMTDVRALTCTAFYFIFNLLPLLFFIEKYACCHYIRHMGVVRSISRPSHGITRPRASN